MSKLIKGIKKKVSSIVRGVKKFFKKITSSTLGKVLLFAATIWLGGAALGAWGSPFTSINGVLAGGQATGATATAEGLQAASTANIAAAETLGGAAAEGAVGVTAAQGAAATAEGLAAANTANVAAAETLGGAVSQPGFLNKAMSVAKTVGKVANENKLLTAMGFQAVVGAASGASAREAEEEERKRRAKNMAVGEIDLGVSPGARIAGNPGYSINSRMRG